MTTLTDLPLLADENVHPKVIEWLSQQGRQIQSVRDSGWVGASDAFLLGVSAQSGMVILTHDADFGRLAIARGDAVYGNILPATWAHKARVRDRDVGDPFL